VNPIASRLWFRPRVMIKQLGQAHSSSMRLFERQGLRNALSDMGRTSGQPFCGYTAGTCMGSLVSSGFHHGVLILVSLRPNCAASQLRRVAGVILITVM
jgi:hypothetical protein